MMYLHCGWPRTSTSTLQAALLNRVDELAAAGIIYPKRWMAKAGPTHHGLSDLLKASQRSPAALSELTDFLVDHAEGDVLLSAESITLWLLSKEKQDALLALFAAAREVMPTRCIWTLRRFDEVMISLYLRQLGAGTQRGSPAEVLGGIQEPNLLFASMRRIADTVGDAVHVKYELAGTHNHALLNAFDLPAEVSVLIQDQLESGPRRNASLSHKQVVTLLNLDALSARTGFELDGTVLRKAFRAGELEFEGDRRCEPVDVHVKRQIHERALTAARAQSFAPYVDFFADTEVSGGESVSLGPEVITDEDAERLMSFLDLAPSPSARA